MRNQTLKTDLVINFLSANKSPGSVYNSETMTMKESSDGLKLQIRSNVTQFAREEFD